MQTELKTLMEESVQGSIAGRLTFPQVVKSLTEAGVEQYHCDFLRGEKTFYMPDGGTHVVDNLKPETPPAKDFDDHGVEAALRAVQAKQIDYREFCRRIIEAGCVGYIVSLTGRRAIYLGRAADYFIEPFPALALSH